ncbi:MAG: peroxiredoxin, partial [Synergistaceae bacterium]|nr:peroxiredoxin [Synergistaceae bacterium]
MECCSDIARIGQEAPDFSAPGFDAVKGSFESYSLSSCRGKYVLLFFYPGDFTYVCPTELVSIASLEDKFGDLGVQVFVVSTDSKFAHKEWNESELSKAVGGSYPYPMLSDTLGRIGRPYGIFNEKDGVDLRGVVLIDKKGVTQLIYVNAGPIGRNPKELLRLAQALKAHDDNGGKVIPACWIPGEEVI